MVRNSKMALIFGLVIVLLIAVFPVNVLAQNRPSFEGGIVSDLSGIAPFEEGIASIIPATGLKEPDAAEKEWIKKNFPVITQIHPNSLTLERINLERKAKGLKALSESSLDIASFGNEMVFSSTSGDIAGTQVSGALPAGVDNSTLAAFPPIRSQGNIGSCAAWATTYYQFTYENNLARGYTASDGNNNHIFSPKWTYNMINGGADNGSYFSAVYAVEMKNGAALWADFPYDSNYLQWPTDAATWREALNYRPLSWGQISGSDVATLISNLKTQLSNGHLVVIATYVSSWTQKLVGNDPSISEDNAYTGQKIAAYLKNTNQGGHGMTIVGYNDNIWCDLNGNGVVNSGEKGAFKIANSWGTGDWNCGYRWVSYDAMRSTTAVTSTSTWPPSDRSSSGIFWSDNYFTLTASGDYTPSLVAEVTLNHAKRGQMSVSLGTSNLLTSIPASTWTSGAVNYSGGNWGFSGTSSAVDGTFVFDFSDLAPAGNCIKRWFVGINDRTTGSPAVIKSFKLYSADGSGDSLLASCANVPQSADASRVYAWIDYSGGSVNQSPIAAASASTSSGNIPLTVNFDGSGSTDTDGWITSYNWTFGDSSSGTGDKVSHQYTAAGPYTVTLTVTDDKDATGTKTLTIKAVDPAIIIAPSCLTAKTAKGSATLTWKDNSSNEEGFYIERATKSKRGSYSSYTRVGTVKAGVTTFTNIGIKGIYKYRVRAFSLTSGKVSTYSNEVTVTVN